MLLRALGETVPRYVSHDVHLPNSERAVFWFRVLTSGDWDRVVNAFSDAAADGITDSQLAFIALGVALERVDNLQVQHGDGEPQAFELKRLDDGSLDPEHCAVLLPLCKELMEHVQNGAIVTEAERKNFSSL